MISVSPVAPVFMERLRFVAMELPDHRAARREGKARSKPCAIGGGRAE